MIIHKILADVLQECSFASPTGTWQQATTTTRRHHASSNDYLLLLVYVRTTTLPFQTIPDFSSLIDKEFCMPTTLQIKNPSCGPDTEDEGRASLKATKNLILGLYWGNIGIMENQMETTIMENQMEKKMENEMETLGYDAFHEA